MTELKVFYREKHSCALNAIQELENKPISTFGQQTDSCKVSSHQTQMSKLWSLFYISFIKSSSSIKFNYRYYRCELPILNYSY